jgi:hypothetical protein
VIIFTNITKIKQSINKSTKLLIILIILINLLFQNVFATTTESKLKVESFHQIYKDESKDEMNFYCFVRLALVNGAYCYTIPYSIAMLLEFTNLTSTSPRISKLLHLILEISCEIGYKNPIIFPHTITYAAGKGRIHTFGLLGHGNGGSSGYGIADFLLIGFTGIRYYPKDGGIVMLGWAVWCKY